MVDDLIVPVQPREHRMPVSAAPQLVNPGETFEFGRLDGGAEAIAAHFCVDAAMQFRVADIERSRFVDFLGGSVQAVIVFEVQAAAPSRFDQPHAARVVSSSSSSDRV